MIGFATQRLTELENDGLCSAGHGGAASITETNATVIATATGRPRAGAVELRIPKPRKSYFSGFPGTPSNRREGANGGDPGSLHPGHLDALGGRPVKALDRED